jgi:hypothetical protein
MPNSSQQQGPFPEEGSPVDGLSETEATFVDLLLSEGAGSAGHTAAPGDGQDEALRRIRAVFEVLAQFPTSAAPSDLAARVMARIRREKVQSLPIGVLPRGGKRRFRRSWDVRKINLLAMVAALIIIFIIGIPLLIQARTQALRTACADNLVQLAGAFGQYAAANANQLPQIAPPHDRNWLPRRLTGSLARSSDAHCNLANLTPLVLGHARYISWNRLVCPACPIRTFAARRRRLSWRTVSYSYLDQLSPYHYQWNGSGNIVVLADSNPLFSGRNVTSAQFNSFNHGGVGQNILYNNGCVRWATTPNVGPNQHNIWAIGNPPRLHYTGREEPTSPNEIILVP